MQLTSRPAKRPLRVHHVPDAETGYLFDPSQQTLVGVNPVGEGIWELCTGDFTVLEIADELAAHFQMPREAVLLDVISSLEMLVKHGLIELQ